VIFYAGCATPGTPAAGDDCDVWPATVASSTRLYTADNEAGKYKVMFTLTAEPDIEATLV
jgi:hypothetical protein